MIALYRNIYFACYLVQKVCTLNRITIKHLKIMKLDSCLSKLSKNINEHYTTVFCTKITTHFQSHHRMLQLHVVRSYTVIVIVTILSFNCTEKLYF